MKVVHDISQRQGELVLKAKELRDNLIDADIHLFGVWWQVRQQDRDNIRVAIETAERLGEQAPPAIGWILADNSVRVTTKDELVGVMTAYALRMSEIFTAYATWRAGNKTKPFTMDEA